jgi:spore maturation protein CgeB
MVCETEAARSVIEYESTICRSLYFGELRHGGICLARMQRLVQCGLASIPFDATLYVRSGCCLERSLVSRKNVGLVIVQMNRALQQLARTENFDAVWIDKGVWIWPETLEVLRKRSSRRLAIHYAPDAQIVDNRSRNFSGCIPVYDLLVTTKPFELDACKVKGARQTPLILQG